jgi:hypothetical protein
MTSHPVGDQGGRAGRVTSSANTTSYRHKRDLGERDTAPSMDEDDGADQPQRPRKTRKPILSDPPGRYFACPYYKFDPYTFASNDVTGHLYRSCAGPGFRTVARVKYVHTNSLCRILRALQVLIMDNYQRTPLQAASRADPLSTMLDGVRRLWRSRRASRRHYSLCCQDTTN